MKMILVSLSHEVAEKLEALTCPANGKTGSGLAGIVKKIVYQSLDVELENYHERGKRGPRGPYKKHSSRAAVSPGAH
jgi:hypothetical protein